MLLQQCDKDGDFYDDYGYYMRWCGSDMSKCFSCILEHLAGLQTLLGVWFLFLCVHGSINIIRLSALQNLSIHSISFPKAQ